jgi:hypothetical protein
VADLSACATRLCDAAGLPGDGPARLTALAGGGNNRVFHVARAEAEALLKVYFRHPGDERDRLGAEFAFLRYASSLTDAVPRPLAADEPENAGLYEFVHGRAVLTEEVTVDDIDAAADFVRTLNARPYAPPASRLPPASEACLRFTDHLATVERRVARLVALGTAGPLGDRLGDLVERRLVPSWERVRRQTQRSAARLGWDFDEPLKVADRAVIPADLGFHNALRTPDGNLAFLDFEYAGWDDPARLVADFFCMVQTPVEMAHFERFASRVADAFPDPEGVAARARVILPIHRLKWVGIVLNDFLGVGGARREFAMGPRGEDRLAAQLMKAGRALDDLDHFYITNSIEQ